MRDIVIIKLTEIFQGWYNWIMKIPEIEIIAKKRLKICKACEYKKGKTCGKCGCLLEAKTRSPKSNCPDKRW